jgi:succinate dehydrogenase/fumarate reductase flavoprotein subunit
MSATVHATSPRHRIVVVGGGFGGLNAVRAGQRRARWTVPTSTAAGRRNSTRAAGSAAGGVVERPGLPFHSMSADRHAVRVRR